MKARCFPILFLMVAFFMGPLLHAQSRIDCDVIKSRILKTAVHYCVYVPASYEAASEKQPAKSLPVLYFLHGLGDNERTLFNSGGSMMLDDLRKARNIGEFLIVAPEGGRTFYINSANGKMRYSDFFMQELIPRIESKYRVSKGRANRAISGISMGGYGALRFAFAFPESFSAVSAQSAALITESPQDLDTGMDSGTPLGHVLAGVFGDPIDMQHWRNNDPFVLAERNRTPLHGVQIYFNCGDSDKYGFEKGAAALHAELLKEGIRHEYHLYPGDHSLAYFLSHFDEVMEFHSRAFGLSH